MSPLSLGLALLLASPVYAEDTGDTGDSGDSGRPSYTDTAAEAEEVYDQGGGCKEGGAGTLALIAPLVVAFGVRGARRSWAHPSSMISR